MGSEVTIGSTDAHRPTDGIRSERGLSDTVITSPGNPRLKAAAALRRRRGRDQTGTTLVEGHDELSLALEAGVVPRTVFACPALMVDPQRWPGLSRRLRSLGSEVVQVGRDVFGKLAYRQHPDGLVAIVDLPVLSLAHLRLPSAALLLICEAVEKPGNLGAMLRTADACGVDAVIAADPLTDWGNPNVIRASKGTVFSVPVVSATGSQMLTWLSERGIELVAATPHAGADYTRTDLTGSVAVAVGAEDIGLSDALLAAAAHQVTIPMLGRVNSLNVATTAALILYEARRQRMHHLGGSGS